MKLYKVEGNKAKASTIAKQRVKTPYKGEQMLKPSDTKNIFRNNNIKNGNDSKKNTIKAKGNSIKKNSKPPAKKDIVNIKTKK